MKKKIFDKSHFVIITLTFFLISCGKSETTKSIELQKNNTKIISANLKKVIASFNFDNLEESELADSYIKNRQLTEKRKIISFNLSEENSIEYNGVIDSNFPDSIRAFNENELTTIILHKYKRILAGEYSNGSEAYSSDVSVYFIDYPSNVIYKIIQFENPPEQTIRRKPGDTQAGNPIGSFDQVENAIKNYY